MKNIRNYSICVILIVIIYWSWSIEQMRNVEQSIHQIEEYNLFIKKITRVLEKEAELARRKNEENLILIQETKNANLEMSNQIDELEREIVRLENALFQPCIVTAYCPCSLCCGKADGITASGEKAKPYYTVAMGSHIPLGTKITLRINGLDYKCVVQDRGGKINHDKLDFFLPSHSEALQFGRQYCEFRLGWD